MSEHHSVREALKLLSTAELFVFRCKCDGRSLGEIANALGIKTQVAKLLLANIYDKLAITFLDNRKRQMRLTELSMMLRVAIHNGSLPLPTANDLSGTPAPEMPSHRALAEVQNDERDRLWPVIPLDRPPDEHASWSSSRNPGSQYSDQYGADDASTERQQKNSESTASAPKGRSYRQSGSTKDDPTKTSRKSPARIGRIGLGCILSAAAGITVTFAGLILLNITFQTPSNDEADAAIGTYTEPRDRDDEISVPNPTSTPMPSPSRLSTPVPTPTRFPSRTIPGELVHTSDGTLFQS
jgi:DNA-binding CsgD family transcriptional regulator